MNSTPHRATVAVVHCPDYDRHRVHEAVGRGLHLLGGPQAFFQTGEKILLKPNLLVASQPDNAATTHPEVFRAVAAHLLAAGASLSYGDSPGFGRLQDVARRAGLGAVAEELDVPLADFAGQETVSFPQGGLIKQFTLAPGVLQADGLISLPKLKTHGLTRMTGAIKNQFGCVPGLLKGEFHMRLPNVQRFAEMLVDLNRLLQPRLYIMDGIISMEGNGPRGGTPRALSVLLLSTDPVALDSIACRLMNLDPNLVPTLVAGQAMGLGTMTEIDLVGDPIENLIAVDYAVNRSRASTTGDQGLLTGWAKNLVVPRPMIDPDACTRCGTCVTVCPVDPKAVDFTNGRRQVPKHDYKRCIRCYCCQEMCPESAITVQTPLLGRLIHRTPKQ